MLKPLIESTIYLFLKIFKIIFIFRWWGREGEREGEKHQCVVASHMPPLGDLAHNPGMCPDWEWNQWPFGSQASAQSTEPHQTGQNQLFIKYPQISKKVTYIQFDSHTAILFFSPLTHIIFRIVYPIESNWMSLKLKRKKETGEV